MTSLVGNLMTMAPPIGLVVSLVYLYGIINRWEKSQTLRTVVMGLLFGLGTIVAMNMPIPMAEGIIVDMRNLFIGAAAAFLGPVAGLIALAMGLVTRIIIGGSGMYLGIIGMCTATVAALTWRYLIRNARFNFDLRLLMMGAVISAHNFAGFGLPEPMRSSYFANLVPIIVVFNIVGGWLIGRLIHREEQIKRDHATLLQAARTDPLTKLLNRRSLTAAVANLPALSGGDKGRVVLYLDIDRFKAINDTNGHKAGDAVIQEICSRISNCLRPNDLFCRLGGDEFVIVLPKITKSDAETVAKRCREVVIDTPIQTGEQEISATISMGANWTNMLDTLDDQISRADTALYQAKRNGRDGISFDASFQKKGEKVAAVA